MPTTKKTTAKKTVSKPASARKTPVVKKTVTKKPAAKKTLKRSKANSELRSFRIARDEPAFTTFQLTRQTLYWIILVSFIIFAQLWIISLQVEVASLLDAQQAQLQEDMY